MIEKATPTTETTPTPEADAPETTDTTEAPETTDAPETTEAVETPKPAPVPTTLSRLGKKEYIWGTGRRKASVARVRIRPGDGKFIINKREVEAYFRVDDHRRTVNAPLLVTDSGKTFDVWVNVVGGGITGQAGAISLGLSRALAKVDPELEAKLRGKNLMTRDPRRVERKKYGQPGARKRFQFSKR